MFVKTHYQNKGLRNRKCCNDCYKSYDDFN